MSNNDMTEDTKLACISEAGTSDVSHEKVVYVLASGLTK